MDFISRDTLLFGTWRSFERSVCRLIETEGYSNVRIVGGTGDKGADVIGSKYDKRWLFQAKQWKKPVGFEILKETLNSLKFYDAQVPVVVAANGFDNNAREYARTLLQNNILMQLWSTDELINRFNKLPDDLIINKKQPREYQEKAIQIIVQSFLNEFEKNALIVLATGLGKTFVAAEALRRINLLKKERVLILAHSNPLVEQLEKSFWPFLTKKQSTAIWNGYEHPNSDILSKSDFVFACIDTVYQSLKRNETYDFDIIVVDECHHSGSQTYKTVLDYYRELPDSPFLIGLTATPWRADDKDIREYFGDPKISVDMIFGMNHGFLTNVDYRIHTNNINWDSLKDLEGNTFTPSQINRTFFINQWDNAVIEELQKAWYEQTNPRAIVFCGTLDHAEEMKKRINALSFCYAESIRSDQPSAIQNKILCDFSDNKINVICTVDIFNEGIDVPDVNILVFQRVTHSRRIFIQQLGRGLRISEGKNKVIVLDFVSDIRRMAADLDLKSKIDGKGIRLDYPNKVTFKREGGDDTVAESFLREWLKDIATIENADEDSSVLKYPPKIIS